MHDIFRFAAERVQQQPSERSRQTTGQRLADYIRCLSKDNLNGIKSASYELTMAGFDADFKSALADVVDELSSAELEAELAELAEAIKPKPAPPITQPKPCTGTDG